MLLLLLLCGNHVTLWQVPVPGHHIRLPQLFSSWSWNKTRLQRNTNSCLPLQLPLQTVYMYLHLYLWDKSHDSDHVLHHNKTPTLSTKYKNQHHHRHRHRHCERPHPLLLLRFVFQSTVVTGYRGIWTLDNKKKIIFPVGTLVSKEFPRYWNLFVWKWLNMS